MNKHTFNTGALLIGLAGWISMPADAHAPTIASVQKTQNQLVQPKVKSTRMKAQRWGLTLKQYQHYQGLMQQTPSRRWYAQLDPAEVLGLNATTPQAMRRYARIEAKLMHRRVTRELAFNQLYTQAYRSLYPNEKPIQSPSAKTASQSLHTGDHLWLFLKVDSPLGPFVYRHLIQVVHARPGVVLDIYFIGQQATVARIQAWAKSVGLTPQQVKQQTVTLNQGEQRFKKLTHGKSVHLPFIGILHHHHFHTVNLSSVLAA